MVAILRIKYSKTPQGRFLSHLDLLRTMERVFRRARLPLAFSAGFNPHPKVSYASALAVGVTSDGEYLDVQVQEKLPLFSLKQQLDEVMPSALKVLDIKEIGPNSNSLTAVINMARYRVEIPLYQPLSNERIQELISGAMNEPAFFVTRQGKKGIRQVDIREGIYCLEGEIQDGQLILKMDIRIGSQGNVRPEEVVEMLKSSGGISLKPGLLIHREGLFIREGGTVKTPMEG